MPDNRCPDKCCETCKWWDEGMRGYGLCLFPIPVWLGQRESNYTHKHVTDCPCWEATSA